MAARDVFIVGAARTPIGAFLGSLSEVPAPRLGSVAIRAAVDRAGIDPNAVDECFMGHVLSAGVGQAPARQAAKGAGLPDRTPCTTVSKVCGSGLAAVIHGAKSIALGEAELVVAGGMESMSNAPYLLPRVRAGLRLGHGTVVDSVVHDGLWDPYNDFHMGNAGELCARELEITREAQDAYARQSYQRARDAQDRGAFAREIAAVRIPGKKGDVDVVEDEEPRRGNPEKMAALRPAFDPNGTITAANASKLNDGAAAVVLASGATVDALGLRPLARLRGYASHAQAPEWFTTAPVSAIERLLTQQRLSVSEIDLFEINEAFSVVALACAHKANIGAEKLNVRGGAVALGHPIGASGARILTTLLFALQDHHASRGVASICIGGGEALAVLVERA